ncbi:DUF2059 domain-containing protein [Paucibacter sp. PLA-PC-4]|uniref:DUF2059 domain-containing protein n=1 Tax=Paucibacter sp. PLA-PC-4 TaxID=2993655 RepID=UPI002248CCA4|nr:DUF2059 domain-containing protein [Paucibacter sp. PLA-PC-4]MCX2860432.1 DUF2059 domain-containing protein [Paucibacter sp. PLA-PC-4]
MRLYLFAIVLSLCCSQSAQAAGPTPESVERLLELTDSQKTVAALQQQVSGMMKPMFDQMIGARELNAEQRQRAEAFAAAYQAKAMPLLLEEMSWERMKALSVQIYSQTFTQEEIDGLIAFYGSPAGRAFVVKLPLVLQQSMASTQQRMGQMMQRMQAIAEATAAEFKAEQQAAKR